MSTFVSIFVTSVCIFIDTSFKEFGELHFS
jgi:hypothetical protein